MPSYIRECSEAYLWGVNNLAKSWGKLLEWLRPAYSQTGCAAIHCQWVPCCWSNSLTSANVHTQVLEWLFERRNSLLHSQQQARERERGLSAARQEWVDMYWVHLGAPASMMHHPVARTGLHPPLHLHQYTNPPFLHPSPPPLAYNPVVFHFKRNSFNSICLFLLLRGDNIIFREKCLSMPFHNFVSFAGFFWSNLTHQLYRLSIDDLNAKLYAPDICLFVKCKRNIYLFFFFLQIGGFIHDTMYLGSLWLSVMPTVLNFHSKFVSGSPTINKTKLTHKTAHQKDWYSRAKCPTE